MRFITAIKSGFANYFNTTGFASRGDFWFWILFACILLCLTLIIDGAYLGPVIGSISGEDVMAFDQDAARWLSLVTLILLIPPTITNAIRRIQDVGFSKWWVLIALTGVGLLPVMFLLLSKGKKKQ